MKSWHLQENGKKNDLDQEQNTRLVSNMLRIGSKHKITTQVLYWETMLYWETKHVVNKQVPGTAFRNKHNETKTRLRNKLNL